MIYRALKRAKHTQCRAFASTARDMMSEKYDLTQVAQLEDSLTQVDEEDNVLGSVSKFDGHFKVDGNRVALPHRAFSLFIFNSRNELLM